MKIHNISNPMNYKGNIKPVKNEELTKPKNYDVIDIKLKPGKDNPKLNSIKDKIVNEINTETKLDKINRIKESLNNKTYNVDIEEIVNKLFK